MDDQLHAAYTRMDSVAGAFAQLDGNVHLFAATKERHRHVVAGTLVVEEEVDVELTGDFLTVDGHDDVATDGDPAHASFRDTIATLNAGGSGRTALRGALHRSEERRVGKEGVAGWATQ